jgi:hypothetical protein
MERLDMERRLAAIEERLGSKRRLWAAGLNGV